jgi:magnesium transporter
LHGGIASAVPAAATPLWIDVSSATPEELQQLAQRYHLHPTEVEDCLQPAHLPKHQKLGSTTFIIIRAYDDGASPSEASVQAMTRKVALFLGDRFLLTIHRDDLPFMAELRARYAR